VSVICCDGVVGLLYLWDPMLCILLLCVSYVLSCGKCRRILVQEGNNKLLRNIVILVTINPKFWFIQVWLSNGIISRNKQKRMKREKLPWFPFEAEDIVALTNTRRFCEPWVSEYFMFTYTEIWFVWDMNRDVRLHAVK